MIFNLTEYLNKSIEGLVKDAIKTTLRNPKGTAFFLKHMGCVATSNRIREEYEKQGRHIPPFLIASITNSCNLFCKGCYARENKLCGEGNIQNQLSGKRWEEIFHEAESIGISFILLAGGEPLMRSDILACAGKISGIIFPVFTNGTLIGKDYIDLFDNHRNLIPIISLEGNKEQTDKRRGTGTYDLLRNIMNEMHTKHILYGTSITVTTENISTVTNEEYIRGLYKKGCKIIFYVEYVPALKNTEELAPSDREREYLETRVNDFRKVMNNVIFISFPGDEKATGGCLAAGRGFFHINPEGKAEPCPFSPYSDTNVKDLSLLEALDSPLFQKLNNSGLLLQEHTGGCVLFSREEQVSDMLKNS